MKKIIYITAMLTVMLSACHNKQQAVVAEEPTMTVPAFNADSALNFCAEQCNFGPRTMNSKAHDRCGEWIISSFEQYGCKTTTQKAELKGWDGTMLRSTNIIASVNPESTNRLIICAHWDSRPWADNDPDKSKHHTPVMAANDGASGVAVMLELARTIQCDTTTLPYGIDFVCFDAEDYGTPQWSGKEDEDSWALGAQHFAKNMPATYECGILLDMVGGQGAHFYQEGYSMHYANGIVNAVWQAASEAGYSAYFLRQPGGTITDDHKPLNEAGIPTIDIIPYYPDCEQSCFGPTWHTVNDDMQHIDRNTLQAVGQTLIQYLYSR